MIFTLLKSRHSRRRRAEALYRAAMTQTRRPEFYVNGGVTDTFEGRFDLLVLHVALVLFRLKSDGDDGRAVGQDMFDLFFADMDAALREMGVGDTSVGRRIREMSEAFYGRLEAYDRGLAGDADDELNAAVARNLYGAEETEKAPLALAMAGYMRAACARMRQIPLEELVSGQIFPGAPEFEPDESRAAESVL